MIKVKSGQLIEVSFSLFTLGKLPWYYDHSEVLIH